MEDLYSIKENDIDTILGTDIVFEGEIHMKAPILIKGEVLGTIHSTTEVYISEEARVQAKVTASHLSVHGSLEGDVSASERIELFRTARVNSNIKAVDLVVQSGSYFNGSCTMVNPQDSEHTKQKK